MDHPAPTDAGTVAIRLRPVVYAFAAANIVVTALLLSTVTPAPSTGGERGAAHEIASLQ